MHTLDTLEQSSSIDLRIKQLSYSSRLTFHSCPRKYQLYKLNVVPEEVESSKGITFAFGKAVGLGIQTLLIEDKDIDDAIFAAFVEWDADLLADNPKQSKSFWLAVAAIQKFAALQAAGFWRDWKLVYYKGKPAIELSFIVMFPDGFTYKGFIDAVLEHRETGEVKVGEFKTTSSSSVHYASYKNSSQAVGYSTILDVIFADLSSYMVEYLVYKTKSGGDFESLPFEKSYLNRALWIKEILQDIKVMEMYEEDGIWPMRGQSCLQFFQECEYLNICTLPTEKLSVPLSAEGIEEIHRKNTEDFDIVVSIEDLIQSQLDRAVS